MGFILFSAVRYLVKNDYIDGNGNLTMAHDAAHHYLGGTWRMPTGKEIDELLDNTISEWVSINGVYGIKLKSKTNDNCIFFPSAGYFCNSLLYSDNIEGHYWDSSINPLLNIAKKRTSSYR